MSLVAAALANYLLGVVYFFTGLSLNFFPALFAALIIALALHSLFVVSSCAAYCIIITTITMHYGLFHHQLRPVIAMTYVPVLTCTLTRHGDSAM